MVPVTFSLSWVGAGHISLYLFFLEEIHHLQKTIKNPALPKAPQLGKDGAGQVYMPPDS